MKDLVQRLRDAAALPTGLYAEAANAIERLESEALAASPRMENDKLEMDRLNKEIDDVAYTGCKLMMRRNAVVVERDRLLATNDELVLEKESNTIAFLAMRDERDGLAMDAARYTALRLMSVKLSLPNDTIAMLLKDQGTLDATIAESRGESK